MKLFDKILYELLTKHYVERNVLQAMNGSAYGVNKQLKLALEAGFVKCMQHTIREGRHQKTIDIFCLATKGFQYICDEMTSLVPWVEKMAQTSRVRIAGPSHAVKTIAERYIKISTAATMADFAGAAEYTTFLTSDQPVENNGSPLMSNLVTAAFREYYQARELSQRITFRSSLEIKSAIAENARQHHISEPDLRGGRYAGIIDGPAMTALVYISRGIAPLTWHHKFYKREMSAYTMSRQLFYQHSYRDRDTHAIMLVHDMDGFVRSYSASKLGDGFSHFWVIPINQDGVQELRWLLTEDRETEERLVIDEMLEDGNEDYYDNHDQWSSTFPLTWNPYFEDEEDVYVSVCLHLDVVRMRHIKASIKRHAGYTHKIVCRAWQEQYIRVVLGDVAEIVPIADEYCPVEWAQIKQAVEIEAEAKSFADVSDS